MKSKNANQFIAQFFWAAFAGLVATLIFCCLLNWETIGAGMLCVLFALPAPAIYCAAQVFGIQNGWVKHSGFLVQWIMLSLFIVAAQQGPEGQEMAMALGIFMGIAMIVMHIFLVIFSRRKNSAQ